MERSILIHDLSIFRVSFTALSMSLYGVAETCNIVKDILASGTVSLARVGNGL